MHRRIGITVSLLLIWLSISGVLLNHSADLSLDQQRVTQGPLMSLYGMQAPEIQSYRVRSHWLSHLGGKVLYFDDWELIYCEGPVGGAVWVADMMAIACADALILATEEGVLIERLTDLPAGTLPIIRLAPAEQGLYLQTGKKTLLLDLDQLTVTPYEASLESTESTESTSNAIPWALAAELPDARRERLLRLYSGAGLSWERVLLDLHSGRSLGLIGLWLLDSIAILLIILSVTGIWVWTRRR